MNDSKVEPTFTCYACMNDLPFKKKDVGECKCKNNICEDCFKDLQEKDKIVCTVCKTPYKRDDHLIVVIPRGRNNYFLRCNNFCFFNCGHVCLCLFFSFIIFLFSLIFGSMLYTAIHEDDEEQKNKGLTILYGFAIMAGLFLFWGCCFIIFCRNWGVRMI